MTPALYNQVLDRLTGEAALEPEVVQLVDAACQGQNALNVELETLGTSRATRRASERPGVEKPGAAYLKTLEVAGFRGIGPASKLEVRPGPGLTLVVGRNGSGKSSFSEGFEALLTGESRRWSSRHKDWRHGWQNLHTAENTHVEATLTVEGMEPVVLRRVWKAGGDVDGSELRARCGASALEGGLDALGWLEPLVTYRPFLSYAELGAVLEEPSKLYDPLKRILGLEEIAEAVKRLSTARKGCDDLRKLVKTGRAALLVQLAAIDDERAAVCKEALSGKKHDLEAIERVVLVNDDDDDATATDHLRRLAQLPGPDLGRVDEAVAAVRTALATRADLAVAADAESAGLAQILEHALNHVQAFGGPCPVCETPLGDGWAAEARRRLDLAKTRAADMSRADSELKRAAGVLGALITPVPACLPHAVELGLGDEALTAWRAWATAPDDARELCEHVESKGVDLCVALEGLRPAARTRLESLQSVWTPVARSLVAWLVNARRAESEHATRTALNKAEAWLKATEASLRDDLFEPIAGRAQEIWKLLRQNSNVDLAGVKLDGAGTRRRVVLDVTVDGTEGVALGVMSQGELNALALSLFIPRMTLGESPFHFVVIDDPVQAMDPHKVDGLAMVLAGVAKTRQVIVLTHDNRLYEAIRRLGIEATVLEAQRRAESVVELVPLLDPVDRHLGDAIHCAHDRDKIGRKIAGHTVPTFCRLAIEAACTEVFRRRRLAGGEPHLEVERALEKTEGTHKLLALALDQHPDTVYTYLKKSHGSGSVDLIRRIKAAAHTHYSGDLFQLVRDTRALTDSLRGAT